MSNFQVNLTNCDHEPIHIPGQVQSHGFLIVIDELQLIRFYSDNVSEFVPAINTAALLGMPFSYVEDLFGSSYQPGLISQVIVSRKAFKNFDRINPVPVSICGNAFYLVIAEDRENLLLEFEPAMSNFDIDVQSMMGNSIAGILSFSEIQQLLDNAAMQVKQITSFDRVMIYRFAADGHGEVVAEDKNKTLAPWVGLHYPASDIPVQARELYKINLTRLIADVDSFPSKITGEDSKPEHIDLTNSQLRAVSPIHIQYLKNMYVKTSFSISLKFKEELWGLIACHNYSPRFIDYKSRAYAKLIGQILSSALEFRSQEESMRISSHLKINLEKISRQLLESDIEVALTAKSITILDIVKTTGAVLIHDKKVYKLGVTPSDVQLLALTAWINKKNISTPVFETNNLSAIYPDALSYTSEASGILIAVLSKELGDYLVWFRPEQVKTINWAGKAEKTTVTGANGLLNISPRNSFEVWTETVSGFAQSWGPEEIAAVIKLKEEISYGILHKAGEMRVMNERLRLAYLELESFSYTISHDLKNPIASIKSYAQLLKRDQTVLERGQKMLQLIADRADQMNLMINAVLDYSRLGRTAILYKTVNTGSLIADIIEDLKLVYNENNFKITVGATPVLRGDPIMILQVFSNLISNAVKYSQHVNPAVIHIAGEINGNKTHYSISDNGLGIEQYNLDKIFELFNRMENVKAIEGSGVGLAIVKRIVERHGGSIRAESEMEKGSVFHITFEN